MPKADYIATNDGAFAAQLSQFQTAIPGYAATLGVTPAQVAAQALDAEYYAYVLAAQSAMQAGSQQWTGWKKLIRSGGTPPPSGAPVPPVFPAAVAATAPGIEARFRALARQIKAHDSYNDSIGLALGIEGSEHTTPDLATIQPVLEVTASGNRVEVDWGWQGQGAYLDLCEIQVDRGAGFTLLAYDTTPGYVDTAPFPATPAKWTYRAIYRVGDDAVGQWSNPVSLTVGA
jgi:hypothetical protein